MRRRTLALLLSHLLIACASTPEPRPVALDPSNPEAPRAPSVAPLEAFASGPQGLNEPLLPPAESQAQPGGQSPAHGHEGHGSPNAGTNEPTSEGHRHPGGEAAPEPTPPAAAPSGHEGHEGHAP